MTTPEAPTFGYNVRKHAEASTSLSKTLKIPEDSSLGPMDKESQSWTPLRVTKFTRTQPRLISDSRSTVNQIRHPACSTVQAQLTPSVFGFKDEGREPGYQTKAPQQVQSYQPNNDRRPPTGRNETQRISGTPMETSKKLSLSSHDGTMQARKPVSSRIAVATSKASSGSLDRRKSMTFASHSENAMAKQAMFMPSVPGTHIRQLALSHSEITKATEEVRTSGLMDGGRSLRSQSASGICMNTSEAPTSRSMDEFKRFLTCVICLDIFTNPRMLPCHHTFCLKCIQNLLTDNPRLCQCPICRRRVDMNHRGADMFPLNFYLNPEELAKARTETHCPVHSSYAREFFCADCSIAVCKICIETAHKQHTIQNILDVAQKAQIRLIGDKKRLEKELHHMSANLTRKQNEMQSVLDKRAAMEQSIFKKHATIVAMANKCRDDLLASINEVSGDIESHINSTLIVMTDKAEKLHQLQKRTEEAISGAPSYTLLAVDEDMRESRGSYENVNQLESLTQSTIYMPVQKSKATLGVLKETIKDIFGTVYKVEMQVSKPEVKTVEQFRCGNREHVDIFSVCPVDDGECVWLSYELYGTDNDSYSEKYDENGAKCLTSYNASGKASFKSRTSDDVLFLQGTGHLLQTYSKSHTDTFLHLINHLKGKAFVKTLKIVSEDPLDTDTNTLFSIKVGAHRAFDVDSSQQLFVVLEEGQTPDDHRKVQLYRRNKEDAVATYSPPTASCQPSDVCFYKLGRQEVLIVSDEGTDSLHVVEVKDESMCFKRYLDAGSSLLMQPTALNTDTKGRLWIACRGGAILTMSPIVE